NGEGDGPIQSPQRWRWSTRRDLDSDDMTMASCRLRRRRAYPVPPQLREIAERSSGMYLAALRQGDGCPPALRAYILERVRHYARFLPPDRARAILAELNSNPRSAEDQARARPADRRVGRRSR